MKLIDMKKFLIVLLFLALATPTYARYKTISWDETVGATKYNLYWGPTSGGPYTYSNTVRWKGGFIITAPPQLLAINEETTYMVVKAVDETGEEGPASAEMEILAGTARHFIKINNMTLVPTL